MPPPGWAVLAEAAERTARKMKPQHVANTLKALSKPKAAAAAVPPPGWVGLAEAVARTASRMKQHAVAMTLDALGFLPAAATEMPPSARKHLEATGAKAEAWCLLIHADASLSPSRSRRREGGSQHDLK